MAQTEQLRILAMFLRLPDRHTGDRRKLGRMAGTDGGTLMGDFGEPISSYSDRDAVSDGVLVPIPGEGHVNRVTRAVFDHFTESLGSSPITGPVTNIGPLMEVIRAVLKVTADSDGRRTLSYQGKELWLLPNEVGGLTLMFPEDY